MSDLISRKAAIAATWKEPSYTDPLNVLTEVRDRIEALPPAQPEQRWIPVTHETLPNLNSVVVVCGEKGTWDFGIYRGWYGDIHSWNWKNKSIKHVHWWMYKDDALPEPYGISTGQIGVHLLCRKTGRR